MSLRYVLEAENCLRKTLKSKRSNGDVFARVMCIGGLMLPESVS